MKDKNIWLNGIMGVVVGSIVLAIYSPMLSMYDAVDSY